MNEKTCSKKNWCLSMERALEPVANSHKKGFHVVMLMHLPTGKERVIGVAYRKAPKDRGLMLNHCPWCNEKILWEKDTEDYGLTQEEKDDQERPGQRLKKATSPLLDGLAQTIKTGDLTPLLNSVGKSDR